MKATRDLWPSMGGPARRAIRTQVLEMKLIGFANQPFGLRKRYGTALNGMLRLAMAARRSYVLPAVMPQQSDNFADPHLGSTGELLAVGGHGRRIAAIRPSELPRRLPGFSDHRAT